MTQNKNFIPLTIKATKEWPESIATYSDLFIQLYEVCKEYPHLLDFDENDNSTDINSETKIDDILSTAPAKEQVVSD